MGQRNKFSEGIKAKASKRQHDMCAACGGKLDGFTDEGFQVVPRKSVDDSDSNAHVWIRSADNCVIVCEPCNSKYGRRWMRKLRPNDFKFSHGKNRSAHQNWVGQMNVLGLHAWSSTDEGFNDSSETDDAND